jgi:branched-chain amino acid transport system permease protein
MNPQIIVNGLLLGALYALIGLGFSLVWGVMNIINIAHGAFIMLGAYVAYWAFTLAGIDPFLSIILAMVVLFVLAYLIQQYVINFVVKSGVFVTLILTFGLNIFLKNVALFLWSGNYRTVRTEYSGEGLNAMGLVLPYNRIGIVLITIVITFAFHRFLTRTKTGRTIMATALNKEAAQLVGVDIGRVYALTFGLAAALAGAAGAMMSTIYAVTPVLGDPFIGKAFVVATLGGLGTMVGAIIGGVILGLAETMGGAVFGSGYQDAIAFAVLIIVLIVRPEGIIGRQFFAEVQE